MDGGGEAEDPVSIQNRGRGPQEERQLAERGARRYGRMWRGRRGGSSVVALDMLAEPHLLTPIPSALAPDFSKWPWRL